MASVVLDAAKKERAKQEAQEAVAGTNTERSASGGSHGHGKVQGNGHRHGQGEGSTSTNGSTGQLKQINGHLTSPFDWAQQESGNNRTFTSSPEPLSTPPVLTERDYVNAKPNGSTPARKIQQSSQTRPPPSSLQSQKRRMSSRFLGTSTRADNSHERQKYTSQSSGEDHEHDLSSRNSSSLNPLKADNGNKNSEANNGEGRLENGHLAAVKSSSSSSPVASESSPMRGPFSRQDSTRGETMLAQRNASAPSNRGPAGYRTGGSENGNGIAVNGFGKGVAPPTRRMSTDGYDSRRQSNQASHRQFLPVMSGSDDEEGQGEEEALSENNDNVSGGEDGNDNAGYFRNGHRKGDLLGMPKSRLNQSRSRESFPSQMPQRRGSARSHIFDGLQRRRSEGFNGYGDTQRDGTTQEGAGPSGSGNPPQRSAVPRYKTDGFRGQAKDRWDALRQRMRQERKSPELDKGLTGSELITDLSSGLMSVMMLKMAFDRDEHNQHRVSCD